MPCRFPGPQPREKLRGFGRGGSPGPQPRGKLRGVWPGGLQAHTRGGLLWGVPAPGGVGGTCSGGSAPRGGVVTPPVMATAAGGTHPTRINSC